MPKVKRYSDPEKRELARQIRELRERIERLEVWKGNFPTTGRLYGAGNNIPVSGHPDDEPAHEALQDAAESLSPPAYYLTKHAKGWYTVDSGATGEPIHKGKLRKEDAEAMLKERLSG